jgi:hypothetical protein
LFAAGSLSRLSPVDLPELSVLPLRLAVDGVTRPFTQALERARGLRLSAPSHTVEGRALETATLSKLAALPPVSQQLVWLEWLLFFWGPGPHDGLHTFCYLGVDYADAVQGALVAAGFARRADIFARAIAMFAASSYPADFLAGKAAYDDAFSAKAKALGREFGDREGYTREVDAYVAGTRDLLMWVRAAVPLLPDEERLQCLSDQLRHATKHEPERVATWPRAYRLAYLVDRFDGELRHAERLDDFLTSSVDEAPGFAAALREVGLSSQADTLLAAVDLFREPHPGKDVGFKLFALLHALQKEADEGVFVAAISKFARDADILPR